MELKGRMAELAKGTQAQSSMKLADLMGQKLIRPLPVIEDFGGVHQVKLTGVKEGDRGFRFTVEKDNTEYAVTVNINNNPDMFLESLGNLAMQLGIPDAALSTEAFMKAAESKPEIYILATQKGAFCNYSFSESAIVNALRESGALGDIAASVETPATE